MLRRRRLHDVVCAAASAIALLLALACTPPEPGDTRWVVLARGGPAAIDPGERIPEGSELLLADLERPEQVPRPIAEGFVAAGAPAVSWDGRRLLFVGRGPEDSALGLWSLELPGTDPRRLPSDDRECGSVDLLPDGRLVFSARVEGTPPTPELSSRWALFVLEPETGEVRRITFGLSEIDPTVLADGRILYSQWQPAGDGRGETGAFALFAVHPDGTGVTPVHGFHHGPTWKVRAWQLDDGDLMYLAGDDSTRLEWRRVDRRSPADAAVALEPAAELASAALARGYEGSLLVVDSAGLSEIGDDPTTPRPILAGVTASQVVSAAPRPRPQGHLSMVDPELDHGRVFGVDARPPGRLDAARLRVRALLGSELSERVLGTVELAEDGSFFVEVPANLPLLLDVLDVEGRPVEVSTTPIWVRPGEKRGCVGCHEDPDLAPPNRRPLAVLEPAVDLTEGTS